MRQIRSVGPGPLIKNQSLTLGSEMENKTQTNSLRIIHIIASECFNDSIKKSYLRNLFNNQGYKPAVNKYIVTPSKGARLN